MAEEPAHIVIISPNAAFSAFAESVLSSWPDIAVHAYQDIDALSRLHFHPLVIACNFEFTSGFYDGFAPLVSGFRLKGPVATLAIVRRLDGWTRAHCNRNGIDEVVVKPISPMHLGLRLAALATGQVSAPALQHSAEIVPFPIRSRSVSTQHPHPFAS